MDLHEVCKACPLGIKRKDGDLSVVGIPPDGIPSSGVYVLGEAPGLVEAEKRRPFVGPSGALLKLVAGMAWKAFRDPTYRVDVNTIVAVGTNRNFHRSDAFTGLDEKVVRLLRFGNSVWSLPLAKSDGSRTPTPKAIACCRSRAIPDIDASGAKCVVAVGRVACHSLLGASVRIHDVEGAEIPLRLPSGREIVVLPVEHPASALRGGPDAVAGWAVRAVRTFHRAYRLASMEDTGIHVPDTDAVLSSLKLVRTRDELDLFRSFVDKAVSSGRTVAIDIETNALRPYPDAVKADKRILCFAVDDGEERLAVLYDHREAGYGRDDVKGDLERLFTGARLVAHNASFELEWLLHDLAGGDIARMLELSRHVHMDDTFVASFVLDPTKSRDLGALTLTALGIDIKTVVPVDIENIENEDVETMLRYCSLDAWSCRLLFERMSKRLEDEGLVDTYTHFVSRVLPLILVQLFGVKVDTETAKEILRHCHEMRESCRRAILEDDDMVLFVQKTGKEPNPNSSQVMAQFFFDFLGIEGERTTNRAALEERIDHPVAKHLADYRFWKNMADKYMSGMTEAGKGYVFSDGRVHTNFNPVGARTGRISASDPPLQQLPKRRSEARRIRSIFVAGPGRVFCVVDYAAMEVRGIATLSGDPVLVRQIVEGEDIHAMWTRALAEADPAIFSHIMTEEEVSALAEGDAAAFKRARTFVKNVFVFPLFYGSSPSSVANGNLRLPKNSKQARLVLDVVEEFWRTYEGVRAWHGRLMAEYTSEGILRLPNGLVHRGPLSKTCIYNWPVQGLCADACIDALVRLSRRAAETGDPHLHPVLNVHDELVFEVPEEAFDRYREEIVRHMLVYSLMPFAVPLEVEVSRGTDYASLDDVGAWSSSTVFEGLDGSWNPVYGGFVPNGGCVR